MKWEFIRPLESKMLWIAPEAYDWKIPYNYLPTRYYDLFTLLFKLENALRIFVYYVLKSNLKDNWSNVKIGDAKGSTLANLFEQRKSEHEKYGYLSFGSNNPMLYLTLNDLFSLITSESLNEYFDKFISGSREVWGPKLGEVKAIRNNLSHFRKIADKDIERVTTTIEDLDKSLLPVFGELFDEENFKTYQIASDESLLSAWNFLLDHVSNSVLELETSRADSIVKLTIRTRTKIVSINQYTEMELFINYCGVRLTRIGSLLADILPYVLYFTCNDEIVPSITGDNKFSGEMTPFEICLFFNKVQFQENHQTIFSTIKDLLNEVESDCHKIDEKSEERLRVYLSFRCNLLDDLSFITEPTLAVEERHIEDWSGLRFHGRSFIDFFMFPWIGEMSVCSPKR